MHIRRIHLKKSTKHTRFQKKSACLELRAADVIHGSARCLAKSQTRTVQILFLLMKTHMMTTRKQSSRISQKGYLDPLLKRYSIGERPLEKPSLLQRPATRLSSLANEPTHSSCARTAQKNRGAMWQSSRRN